MAKAIHKIARPPVAAAAGCDRLRSRRKPGIAVFQEDRGLRFCGDCVADRSLRQRLQGLDVWWKYPRPAPQAINGCTAMSR
ncbi:hypothetical protein C4K24_0784 [Pseudomonas chlororaphis subsp. aurantiaca]|nr:hypothetical protein C4K24_0784 [Pseudomonas chlororaphis subsp. aurantiaca]AZD46216.1 hypothetical protein C4K20_0779 [Pseudomonas chlororaphis subsp. aurantiaca]AZD58773.1 hypothetical protein C4K18_0778 [Pseudomonas chlororaphis subsp. aurantiaca]